MKQLVFQREQAGRGMTSLTSGGATNSAAVDQSNGAAAPSACSPPDVGESCDFVNTEGDRFA